MFHSCEGFYWSLRLCQPQDVGKCWNIIYLSRASCRLIVIRSALLIIREEILIVRWANQQVGAECGSPKGPSLWSQDSNGTKAAARLVIAYTFRHSISPFSLA